MPGRASIRPAVVSLKHLYGRAPRLRLVERAVAYVPDDDGGVQVPHGRDYLQIVVPRGHPDGLQAPCPGEDHLLPSLVVRMVTEAPPEALDLQRGADVVVHRPDAGAVVQYECLQLQLMGQVRAALGLVL